MQEKLATLTEIETTWNIQDIMQANALIDFESDCRYLEEQRQENEAKRGR